MASDCTYCGAKPANIKIHKNTVVPFAYNGIDRVDNAMGYTSGNTVACCKVCNRAKEAMPLSEFAAWAKQLGAMADQWGVIAAKVAA